MALVQVPAKKALVVYQGRSYVRGELITCEAVQASAMARRGEVSLDKDAVITREVEAEHEPTQEDVEETQALVDAEPNSPRRRRQYRRRDLTAEGRSE